MMRLLLVLCFAFISFSSHGQYKIIYLNGKVKTVYGTISNEKIMKMNSDRIFSVQLSDGTERILYSSDSLDPNDFSLEEMRMFIKGEQEAGLYYRNNLNMGVAMVLGEAASLLTIYGLVIPPLYATIYGGISPDMNKQQVSDPSLLYSSPYKEGYSKKVRERKIRNGLISGVLGFAVGFTLIAVTQNN